jgi:hypothetical protein
VAADPIFVGTPRFGAARNATANTARDGTGTLGTVFTAGVSGSRIDRIVIRAGSTTTAGVVRIFVDTASTVYLWNEILVTAITPSGTVVSFERVLISPEPGVPLLILPASHILKFGTHNAETFDVMAIGGDF